MRRWRCPWIVLLAALLPAPAMADILVRFPRPESGPDARTHYAFLLLQQVLQRAPRPYRVEQHPVRMVQGRALLQLENNDGIDVISTMTSTERELRLQPIRIPIDKGLLGWRLLLIKRSQQGRMDQIRSAADLKHLTAGQGSDWPDTAILRANGMKVYGTTNYDSLFNMLESGRIAYFPRAVTEIWAEADLYRDQLEVEQTILLRYPTALYFFVRKQDRQLAADLHAGLEKMIADGSFEKLFQEYYGDIIVRSNLKARRVIELHNPLMPASLPLERKHLWYHE